MTRIKEGNVQKYGMHNPGPIRPTDPPKAMSPQTSLREQLIVNISGYIDNLKNASKDNQGLCVLLDTIRGRMIEIIWKTRD